LIDTEKRMWVLRTKSVEECEDWLEQIHRDPRQAQQDTIRLTIGGKANSALLELRAEYELSFQSDTTEDPSYEEEALKPEDDDEEVAAGVPVVPRNARAVSTIHSEFTLKQNLTELLGENDSLKTNIYGTPQTGDTPPPVSSPPHQPPPGGPASADFPLTTITVSPDSIQAVEVGAALKKRS